MVRLRGGGERGYPPSGSREGKNIPRRPRSASSADRLVLGLDQGTTGTTALLLTPDGRVAGRGYRELRQVYPRPAWVEHDPDEIWRGALASVRAALADARATPRQIAVIGITNQRETTILWDAATGAPVHPAIVWQCRRSAPQCAALVAAGLADEVRRRTGLVVDAYFSASKIQWLLQERPPWRARAERGELRFGTVDAWLLWNLTGGRVHATDHSNAARTMLYNLAEHRWDPALLEALAVPAPLLPEIRDSASHFGETVRHDLDGATVLPAGIPIAAIAGDQHAALFGQACFEPGMVKVTYGTGSFLLMHTGEHPYPSRHGLLTTVAWALDGRVEHALEGSVFIAGAAVQWLRDGLGIIARADETAALAASAPDAGGVYFVPAFVGLGAPDWDMDARGLVIGLTRGTTRAHLARAALEAIAFQVRDVVDAMAADAPLPVAELRVDGGAAANDVLCQLQADLLGRPVVRPAVVETTALGAAYLAGLAVGVWPSRDALAALWSADRRFEPTLPAAERDRRHRTWRRAVERARGWARDDT